MSRVVFEKGDYNRFNNSKGTPSNYPTYLGTTYFPTLPLPTYYPTSTKDASAAAQVPRKKKKKKQDKQKDQLEAAATTPSSRLILTSSPVTTPTSPPFKRPTSTPSKMPTPLPSKRPIITEAPTSKAHSPDSSPRWSGFSRGQSYSRRHTSNPTLTKVSTPTPESSDTAERGQPYSRRNTTYPTVSGIEEMLLRDMPTGAPTSNAKSSGSSPRWSDSSRVQPYSRRHSPVPTVSGLEEVRFRELPTDAPTSIAQSPDSSTRWSGSSRAQPSGRMPSPVPAARNGPIETPEPTLLPTTAAPKGGQKETDTEDDKKKSDKKTESSDTKTGEIKDTTGGNEDKDRDQFTKLNLSFEVKEVPSPSPVKTDSTSKLSLKIYGQGEEDDKGKDDDKKKVNGKGKDDGKDNLGPTMSPVTYEPTYFIFPTLTPTEVVEGEKRNHMPTYMPTTSTFMPTGSPLSFDNRNRVVDYPTSSSPSSLAVEGGSTSIFDKRTCPGYPLGFDPLKPQQEEEVFFAYGIQTNVEAGDSIESTVERIQRWLLEDVASRLLLCPNDGKSFSGRLLKDEKGDKFLQPVSRVYYMKDNAVATLSEFLGSFCNICRSQHLTRFLILLCFYCHSRPLHTHV
jgi:hypothetical protein